MGFSHKARKLRDRVRKQYTDETGRSDWKAPEFRRWLIERGVLEAPSVPQAEAVFAARDFHARADNQHASSGQEEAVAAWRNSPARAGGGYSSRPEELGSAQNH